MILTDFNQFVPGLKVKRKLSALSETQSGKITSITNFGAQIIWTPPCRYSTSTFSSEYIKEEKGSYSKNPVQIDGAWAIAGIVTPNQLALLREEAEKHEIGSLLKGFGTPFGCCGFVVKSGYVPPMVETRSLEVNEHMITSSEYHTIRGHYHNLMALLKGLPMKKVKAPDLQVTLQLVKNPGDSTSLHGCERCVLGGSSLCPMLYRETPDAECPAYTHHYEFVKEDEAQSPIKIVGQTREQAAETLSAFKKSLGL